MEEETLPQMLRRIADEIEEQEQSLNNLKIPNEVAGLVFLSHKTFFPESRLEEDREVSMKIYTNSAFTVEDLKDSSWAIATGLRVPPGVRRH